MPSKTIKKQGAVTLPSIPKELIDHMVSGPMDAEAVNAASMAFKKALIERILSRPCKTPKTPTGRRFSPEIHPKKSPRN